MAADLAFGEFHAGAGQVAPDPLEHALGAVRAEGGLDDFGGIVVGVGARADRGVRRPIGPAACCAGRSP